LNWRRIPTRGCRWSVTPYIVAHWEVTGRSRVPLSFPLGRINTSAATRREDSIRRHPARSRCAEALGGTSKRYFTDVSYVYELTAPMETVIDMTSATAPNNYRRR